MLAYLSHANRLSVSLKGSNRLHLWVCHFYLWLDEMAPRKRVLNLWMTVIYLNMLDTGSMDWFLQKLTPRDRTYTSSVELGLPESVNRCRFWYVQAIVVIRCVTELSFKWFFRFFFMLGDTFLTSFVWDGYFQFLFWLGFVQFQNSRLLGCFSICIYLVVVFLLFFIFYYLLNLP